MPGWCLPAFSGQNMCFSHEVHLKDYSQIHALWHEKTIQCTCVVLYSFMFSVLLGYPFLYQRHSSGNNNWWIKATAAFTYSKIKISDMIKFRNQFEGYATMYGVMTAWGFRDIVLFYYVLTVPYCNSVSGIIGLQIIKEAIIVPSACSHFWDAHMDPAAKCYLKWRMTVLF